MEATKTITKYVVGTAFAAYAAATAVGLYLRAKQEDPFDEKACAKAGCCHVKSRDGRVVAYYVFGSQKPDAKVMVFCHGMGDDGSIFEALIPPKVLERLNVRGIAPSLPSHGFSDVQKGRRIGDWPRDDLEPILQQEGVSKFIVQGVSLGTAHALACGAYFGSDKCVALGVIAPFVSAAICDEFGLENPCKTKGIPGIEFYDKFHNAWIFAVYAMCHGWVIAKVSKMTTDGKKAKAQCPEVIDFLGTCLYKSGARGTVGIVLDEFTDNPRTWGFGLGDIKTKNVAIWYSPDDGVMTPAEGECLARFFQKKGVKTDNRTEVGIGHFTYMSKKYQEQGFQTQALLELAGDA